MTTFKIHVRSGVVSSGGSADFLVCIQKAQQAKASIKLLMPRSTVIAQMFYENGDRVPGADIKAALRSLASSNVAQMVANRRDCRADCIKMFFKFFNARGENAFRALFHNFSVERGCFP